MSTSLAFVTTHQRDTEKGSAHSRGRQLHAIRTYCPIIFNRSVIIVLRLSSLLFVYYRTSVRMTYSLFSAYSKIWQGKSGAPFPLETMSFFTSLNPFFDVCHKHPKSTECVKQTVKKSQNHCFQREQRTAFPLPNHRIRGKNEHAMAHRR